MSHMIMQMITIATFLCKITPLRSTLYSLQLQALTWFSLHSKVYICTATKTNSNNSTLLQPCCFVILALFCAGRVKQTSCRRPLSLVVSCLTEYMIWHRGVTDVRIIDKRSIKHCASDPSACLGISNGISDKRVRLAQALSNLGEISTHFSFLS